MLDDIFDKKHLEKRINTIKLSETGKRVVKHKYFREAWEETLKSLTVENIFRLWGESLGSLLVIVEPGFNHIQYRGEATYLAHRLAEAFIRFYIFNIIQDCIDISPIYRRLSNILLSKTNIDSALEEAMRLSLNAGVDYKKVIDRLYFPVWNTFFPFSMLRTKHPDFSRLARLYIMDRDEFHSALHSYIEDPSRDPIGRIVREIYRKNLDPPDFMLLEKANKLTNELAMINDFNRLIGKEYSKKVLDLLKTLDEIDGIKIDSSSNWPWDILLDVTNKVV